MKLMKAMATVAGLTGLSRIAGFVRDVLTAAIMGAGPVADAFFVALKLPNLFRRVTAEGAFSVSFVPLYTEALEKEGEEKADEFAGNAFSMMLVILGLFTAIAMAAMPYVIYVIAPGFHDDPVRYGLAVELSRVTFPYLLLMSCTALLGGVLNAHDRFAPFAAAPIFFNLTLVFSLLFIAPVAQTPGHAMAYGVFAAGILQFGLLWMAVKRAGLPFRLRRPHFNVRMKKLFRLMGPGAIGAGVMHINLFADLIIASMLTTGSISYLYYADRINQLPLGMVGIAVGTALLPMLSRKIAAGEKEEARQLFNRALEVCFFLTLPAAVGMFMVSFPIIVTLFEHGAFDREASRMTTLVLTAYAGGVPAYVGVKVLSTTFWAKQDTTTPVKVSIAATLYNVICSLWLALIMGYGVFGIAVSTAIAGWIQFGALRFFLRGHEDARLDKRFYISFGKILVSCALMAVYLAVAKSALREYYMPVDAPLQMKIFALTALVAGGAAIYGLAVVALGVVKVSDVRKVMKIKKA